LQSGFTTWLIAVVLLAMPGAGQTSVRFSASRAEAEIVQVGEPRSAETAIAELLACVVTPSVPVVRGTQQASFKTVAPRDPSLFQRPPPPSSSSARS
jgi:hypothetical protein